MFHQRRMNFSWTHLPYNRVPATCIWNLEARMLARAFSTSKSDSIRNYLMNYCIVMFLLLKGKEKTCSKFNFKKSCISVSQNFGWSNVSMRFKGEERHDEWINEFLIFPRLRFFKNANPTFTDINIMIYWMEFE